MGERHEHGSMQAAAAIEQCEYLELVPDDLGSAGADPIDHVGDVGHELEYSLIGRHALRDSMDSRRRGDERHRCRGRLPERLTDTLTGPRGVRVPVQLPDELAAVLVPEVQRDVAGVELEHVPRVPAEVVAGGGVQVDVPEPSGA
jgi:hypothetical protein